MNLPSIYQQIAEVASEYNYAKPPALLVTVQQLLYRMLRLLSDLLGSLTIQIPGITDNRMVSNLMLLIVIFLGGVCLIWLLIAIKAQISRLRKDREQRHLPASTAALLLTADGWNKEADRLAGAGCFKEACRACYFSFLRSLDEHEILPFSATRTNREYYQALVRKSEVASVFREIANLVEEMWFGNRTASGADYLRCQRLLAQATDIQQNAIVTL